MDTRTQNVIILGVAANKVAARCIKCMAIYETARLLTDFVESFECDCGASLSYHVPKIEDVRRGDTAAILDTVDRLPSSGMPAREAIAKAQEWWGRVGAREMRLHGLRQKEEVGAKSYKSLGGEGFASLDPDSDNYLPSKIIAGAPWDDLSKTEKMRVVKVWHQVHVLGRFDKSDVGDA